MVALVCLGAAFALLATPFSGAAPSASAAQGVLTPTLPQRDSAPDRFHPDLDAAARAALPSKRGGSIVLHADALPKALNYLVDHSTMCRRLQREVHETLVSRDPWSLEFRAVLCERWIREDALVLRAGERLFGELEELPETWRVRALSGPTPAPPAREVSKDEVERVIRGAAYTFFLRSDVLWHDGRRFDAQDLIFSWELTRNPFVACDAKRFQYAKIRSATSPAANVVRFEFDATYYASLATFEALPPLPRHLYDLRDPRNPDHDPLASDEKQGSYVNAHRCNREWVGLGPYRVTKFTSEMLEVERFERYFDAQRAGWLERVRWRPITDDRAALQALIAGEIDFTDRLLSDDYFGAATQSEAFTSRCYKGWYYTPIATYVGWNLARERFADVRVRRALALAFDWEEFIDTFYRGLARRVTAEWVDTGPDYDTSLAPLPHDAAAAAELLGQAGWIDRDGDGWLDREGRKFEITLAMQAGNKPGEALSQRLQESWRRLGIEVRIEAQDWPSLSQRIDRRDFDAALLAWVMPVDSDPAQRWHSREVGPRTGNYSSFADAQVDAWIERVEVELDRAERTRLMHAIQARLYELQPYLYGVTVAKRFGISKRIRNVRTSQLDPGYSIREWRLAP